MGDECVQNEANLTKTLAMAVVVDSVVVSVSVFLTLGYHAYLWHQLKQKPLTTSIGINSSKRRSWLRKLNQGDDKKGMLAVQSLRNTLMYTILTATVTVILTLSLAALANNAFNAGLSRMIVVKYGSACVFLVGSLVCSCMAVGFLVDGNFLINAIGEFAEDERYAEAVVERGFGLAVVGNRVLCMAFPLLMWLLGPAAMAVSAVGLVWVLYDLDFHAHGFLMPTSSPT